MGSRNVAVHLGAEAEFGTVAVGRRADLVLLDADPTADVANWSRQAGVMVRGRWYDRAEIARRLDELSR
jgi:imidazolonepropionase-like amidohydrolase